MLEVGRTYKTRGGWDAVVIWHKSPRFMVDADAYYAVHKPGTDDESVPIFHWPDGRAGTTFSINEPPSYDGHPADIVWLEG